MTPGVFLMAAGKGTRLAPLTDVLPKPAIPVANEPAFGRILRLLARHGFTNVVSNISYKREVMKQVFGSGEAYGVDIRWSEEPEPLGTAGGLRFAEEHLRSGGGPVLVLSGDGLHAYDLSALVRAHHDSGALVTIALTEVDDPREFGVVVLDDNGRITKFQEKPAPGTELSTLANTGIYVLDPAVFDMLPAVGSFYEFGGDLFPALLHKGAHLQGVVVPGYWNDIGGLDALREGTGAVLTGALGEDEIPAGTVAGVHVHPSASVHGSAELGGWCAIGADASVGEGAHISDSIVLPGATVPDGATVRDEIVGDPMGLVAWAASLSEGVDTSRLDPRLV